MLHEVLKDGDNSRWSLSKIQGFGTVKFFPGDPDPTKLKQNLKDNASDDRNLEKGRYFVETVH